MAGAGGVDGSGGRPRREVISAGRDTTSGGTLTGLLRRHPLPAVGLVVVGLGVAALVAVRETGDTGPPRLIVSAGPVTDPWQAGWDGRPREPVVLAGTATVSRSAGEGRAVSVLGLDGPGVAPPASVPVVVPPRRSVTVPLRTAVDCDAVPLAVPDDAYRLRVRAGARTWVLAAGAAGTSWGRAVQLACSTFLARRDVTVDGASAAADAAQPMVEVRLSVRNAGLRTVTLSASDSFRSVAVDGTLPLVVPPRGAATATVRVRLDRCDVVESVLYAAASWAALSSQIDVVATAGPLPAEIPVFDSPGDGLGPTGVVLAPQASRPLGVALAQACGGVGPVTSAIPAGGVRLVGRTLAVSTVLRTAPGAVESLTLQPEPEGPQATLRPTWMTTDPLHPDAAGATHVTLSYELVPGAGCSALFSLPPLVATLRLRGRRVIRYSLVLDLVQDPQLRC